MIAENKLIEGIHSKHSFLKLPAIFALIMVVYSICISLYQYQVNNKSYNHLMGKNIFLDDFTSNGILNQLFSYSIFYFFIGIVMFSFQRRYHVNFKNVLIVITISTLYQIVNYPTILIMIPCIGFFNNIYPDMMVGLVTLALIKLLFLIFLFFCVGSVGRKNRHSFQAIQSNDKNIASIIFTILLTVPILAILIQSQPLFIMLVLYSFEVSIIITSISLMSSLLTFVSVSFVFCLTYILVRLCLIYYKNIVPIKLLFKAVAWSYLYLIIINIMFFVASVYFYIMPAFSGSFNQLLFCIGITIVNGILIAVLSYNVVKYLLNKHSILIS